MRRPGRDPLGRHFRHEDAQPLERFGREDVVLLELALDATLSGEPDPVARNLHAVLGLELEHEVQKVERLGAQLFDERRVARDARRIDGQHLGNRLTDGLVDLVVARLEHAVNADRESAALPSCQS